jgi:predicted CXXCH cytochrome family protein
MGKVKWSFSLIFAIFLVGILSTAAFASDPYSLKTIQKGSGLEVSFTGDSNNPLDVEGFNLVVKDGSSTLKEYGLIKLDSTNKGIFNIPTGVLTVGKVYTVELYHSSDTEHGTLLSKASAVITDGHNNPLLNQNNSPKKTETGSTITLDKNGNGLLNSNQTGYNNTKKQRSGQNVHGAYQNNTNSCASCHQTHTAQDDNLLFKDGVYSTCSACHDGTTGAFNSFTQTNADTSNNVAGTFDISNDAHGSIHQADGSLKITSAPGGNSESSSKIWNQDFDCASCHAPHGAGSNNENNLNIDPLGWGGVQYVSAADGGTKDQQNGKLFIDIPIYPQTDNAGNTIAIPTSFVTPYILVKTKASDSDILPGTVAKDVKSAYAGNYFWARWGVQSGDQVIQTYRWDGKKYVPDYSLWLRDKGYKSPKGPYKNADTILKDSNDKDLTLDKMTVIWRDGFAFGPDVAKVVKANVSIGIDVETTGDVRSLYDPSFASYIPDSGVEMTKYCAACHTDFMSNPGTNEQGVLTAYHRHTMDEIEGKLVSDQLTCVRCHFAHGTKSQIMKDSSEHLATVPDSLTDATHSSALKRYINLDSCYTSGCHSKDSSDKYYLSDTTSTTSTTSSSTVTSTPSINSTTGSTGSNSSTDSTSSTTNVNPGTTTPTTDSAAPVPDPAVITP